MIRRHGPILRTSLTAAAVFAILAWRDWPESFRASPASLVASFVAGILYLQFFEYAVHRFAMHGAIPFLALVRRNHLEHHRIFHGANFRTRNAEDLAHIPGRFWTFPLLFSIHYAAANSILPKGPASAFLLASFLHYLVFELSHWFTHLDHNGFDRAVARLPVLRGVRARQIEHHRLHHEVPILAFNFTPPYAGDRFADSMPLSSEEVRPAARPALVPRPPAAVLSRKRIVIRPILLYGTALLLGAAAVGVAVLAHSKSSVNSGVPRRS